MSLNISDYEVLNSVIDRDNGRGMSKLRGITILELAEITNFSSTKVRNSIKKLLEKGFVDFAVKRVRSDAFHITENGINALKELGATIVSIDDDTIEDDEEVLYQYKEEDKEEVLDVDFKEVEGDVQ